MPGTAFQTSWSVVSGQGQKDVQGTRCSHHLPHLVEVASVYPTWDQCHRNRRAKGWGGCGVQKNIMSECYNQLTIQNVSYIGTVLYTGCPWNTREVHTAVIILNYPKDFDDLHCTWNAI